jgi:hypothetical protein
MTVLTWRTGAADTDARCEANDSATDLVDRFGLVRASLSLPWYYLHFPPSLPTHNYLLVRIHIDVLVHILTRIVIILLVRLEPRD